MTSKLANALERNKPNMRITDEKDNLYVHVYGREKIFEAFPLLERILTHDYEDKITITSKDYSYGSWPDFKDFKKMILGDIMPAHEYYDKTRGIHIREYRTRDIFEEAQAAKIYRDFLIIAYEL